ncbi:hypothetical protein NST28_12905 [Paenibacillus sp. FSL R10-2791]|uniref:hypothetical protein n=1 Tax=Paenibacillus sp. FSL R10-2791 TaxID=2954695 RepID=UPI0030FD0D81
MQEPTGQTYKTLVQVAMEVCDEFILVKRDQMELEPEGVELLEQLQPFLKKVIKDDYWPGTRLMGHYADVYFFNCSPEAVDILLSYSTSLYSWVQTRLPDDLCFLKQGQPWLINTAHERESNLITDVNEELNRLEECGLLFRDLSEFYNVD